MALELVNNEEKYWEFIRQLRTNAAVQGGFIQVAQISPEQQAVYMGENNDNYFVCLQDGEPAGYVGVIDGDITVATHPAFQGQGVGTFMIDRMMELRPDAHARVKIGNDASLALFKKCGFEVKYYWLERAVREDGSSG